jgi:hypothetical protein
MICIRSVLQLMGVPCRFSSRRYLYHYIVEGGITYLCLADEDQKRRIPFEFLEDIKRRFQEQYGDRARTATAFAMNQEFQQEIQRRMVPSAPPHPVARALVVPSSTTYPRAFLAYMRDQTYFNENPESDKLGKLRQDISGVRDVMVSNIGGCSLCSPVHVDAVDVYAEGRSGCVT